MVPALSMPPRQLTLSGLPGWPGDRVSEHSDSLIAETPQVPWRWLQNLGLCESQAETQLSSQSSFYAPHG